MFTIAGIGFSAPWLLLALLILPILWLLLRAVPPAPVRRAFPGVALMLGLSDEDVQSDKTPWWLLALRILALTALIIGFAGPVLNPQTKSQSTGPLLILLDGSWAGADTWARRVERIDEALNEASKSSRPVAIASLTALPAEGLVFQTADAWRTRLAGLQPKSWEPDAVQIGEWFDNIQANGFDTYWISDGLSFDTQANVLDRLKTYGDVQIFEAAAPVIALRPAFFEDGVIKLSAIRSKSNNNASVNIRAIGTDPAGNLRELANVPLQFTTSSGIASADLNLQAELRNRITRFEISDIRSAGAVSLTDDALKRREVALIAGRDDREGLELLSPTHFLEQALKPSADLLDGSLSDMLLANPDVFILADVATLAPAEALGIAEWVTEGGLLLRFAGPRLAASDISRAEEDALMPVRLRKGGRSVGGTMSWGQPKSLRQFSETSPFFGLPVPDDVLVSAQVMAQPDPNLAQRVIAALSDGTPLVTRKQLGNGQIVLFHVTANADWSNLPLSGLFVQMLERLAVSTRRARPEPVEMAGTTWIAQNILNGFGDIEDAENRTGVPGEAILDQPLSATVPAGLYAGENQQIALNVIAHTRTIAASNWPAGTSVSGFELVRETILKGWLFAAALVLLGLDVLASLWLSGRLFGPRSNVIASILLLLMVPLQEAKAQNDDLALAVTSEMTLAYVATGNTEVDRIARAGLRGLSDVLFMRTSIEPANPVAVDLEKDELSFFPFLYWPITPDQELPSPQAYSRLNQYLRSGGLILLDTRDANTAQFGAASPNGRKLQQLAISLDIPPLEQIPSDHVLTRAFYLLQDFPGRYLSRDVWVESAPLDAELVEGMPFRNLNDNVTPVIIGGNDWASAWAVDNSGQAMFPVGRGSNGDRQREIAYRFGVNLIMHVLTGNYKSDQVHVPALLDRLGQ